MAAPQNLLPVYQTLDLPLKTVLNEVHQSRWVLPAIQREFVWSDLQICRLFDSMMRGYPFGTFLFWQIEAQTASKFRFYEFMRRYHERDAKTCDELPRIVERQVTAVLDGQQRLTALNIGLSGSRAMKLPNKHRSNDQAYPETFLYLDLLAETNDHEEGMEYDFRFLTPEKAAEQSVPVERRLWFKVSDVLNLEGGYDILEYVQCYELSREEQSLAFKRLDHLHGLVHKTPLISCYTERVQDLSRVLDIFIRMNSGGTVLSYSDLLFSIAVANWELDARREVNDLIDALNGIGGGFSFSKDFVLKSGLMLAEIRSVGFKVENFDRANMATLEAAWPAIRQALDLTVRLVSDFGFTGQTSSGRQRSPSDRLLSLHAKGAIGLPHAFAPFERSPHDPPLAGAFVFESVGHLGIGARHAADLITRNYRKARGQRLSGRPDRGRNDPARQNLKLHAGGAG